MVYGEGNYEIKGTTYTVKEGQAFLIPPGIETYYKVNNEKPWRYYWVGFNGTDVKKLVELSGFTDNKYVIDIASKNVMEHIMKTIVKYKSVSTSSEYGLLGNVYLLFSLLIGDNEISTNQSKESTDHVTKAIKYMNQHFHENITIKDITNVVNLDRTYFSKIFKERMGISPQKYLISLRLGKAQKLLKDKTLSMKEIANMVGYENYTNYLKIFKKKYKMTPSEYAENPFEKE